MDKKLDESVEKMTNPTFVDEMNFLFDLEKMIDYKENDIYKKKTNKKRIAIVYDVDGWAFSNIAREIKTHLSKYYEIDTIPVSVFDDNIVNLLFLANQYDLVHLLWRGLISCIDYDYSRTYIHNMGLDYEDFINKYLLANNITTSVYDHKFLTKDTFENTKTFAKYAKNYTVSSTILKDIYDKLEIDKKPLMVISDGVDLEKFKPKNLERFELENINKRKIKIGWVGNSEFTDSDGDTDLKGVRKIIKPALEELIDEGYEIELKFADRKEGLVPHDKMPDYYNSIDVYICASKNEGTPNPVLESLASGVPIISTNVGIVRDVLGKKQKEFILKERSKECLKETLKKLLNDKKQFKELSKENLEQRKDWSWEKKCEQFKEFFDKNLYKDWRKTK